MLLSVSNVSVGAVVGCRGYDRVDVVSVMCVVSVVRVSAVLLCRVGVVSAGIVFSGVAAVVLLRGCLIGMLRLNLVQIDGSRWGHQKVSQWSFCTPAQARQTRILA